MGRIYDKFLNKYGDTCELQYQPGVKITASVNNGPRSVYLHHIGTFQVYTSFGNNDGPDHLASYGANMIRNHTVYQPHN